MKSTPWDAPAVATPIAALRAVREATHAASEEPHFRFDVNRPQPIFLHSAHFVAYLRATLEAQGFAVTVAPATRRAMRREASDELKHGWLFSWVPRDTFMGVTTSSQEREAPMTASAPPLYVDPEDREVEIAAPPAARPRFSKVDGTPLRTDGGLIRDDLREAVRQLREGNYVGTLIATDDLAEIVRLLDSGHAAIEGTATVSREAVDPLCDYVDALQDARAICEGVAAHEGKKITAKIAAACRAWVAECVRAELLT